MPSTLIPPGRAAPSPHHHQGFGIAHLKVSAVSWQGHGSLLLLWRTKSTIKRTISLLAFCLTHCCPANILVLCDSASGGSLIPWLVIDLSRCDQEINQKISPLHSSCWKEAQMSQNQMFVSISQQILHWWGGSLGFFWRVLFTIETPLPSSEWRFLKPAHLITSLFSN